LEGDRQLLVVLSRETVYLITGTQTRRALARDSKSDEEDDSLASLGGGAFSACDDEMLLG
jgi:hypothetical protein